MQSVITKEIKLTIRKQLFARARRMRDYYLLLVIPVIFLIIFKYIPIYGILMAFKNFRYADGILGSPWNNFEHFKTIFKDPFFFRVFRNTLIISVYRIIFGFPMPIILALLLNEVRSVAYKKTVQTLSYLPHFVSWVVLAGIFTEILSPQRGPIAKLFLLIGLKPVNWLAFAPTFRGLLVATGIWQGVGWGSIVYLAALSSINPNLYEVASIDGANRFQKAVHITVPSLVPVITIFFILSLGGILNAGFEQIFNLYNPMVYEKADVISTYIFRAGVIGARYGYTTAVGLFKTVIGVALIVTSNLIIKRFSEYGIW